MTEEEKKAAAEQKQREMEEMMRQAQESYRQEYASMPYDGPVYGCRREELMLPMQDGVKLYTEIFKPEGLAQFPVLIQRSCYPNQQPSRTDPPGLRLCNPDLPRYGQERGTLGTQRQ